MTDLTLVLYHTSACHLCEKARDLIWPFLSQHNLQLKECDVAESDELLSQYGTRIPVIGWQGRELNWPFTAEQLHFFLQN